MLISLTELPEALRRHVTSLSECVRLALSDFVADHARLRARYSARTEASIIHDYMVSYAMDRFPWKLKRNLFLIAIDEYRAKLKKLDGRWRTRRVPTQLALRFENQAPLRLFDDVDVTNVYLGYQRDEAEILKSGIWLVCPDGKRGFRWIAELSASEHSNTIQVAAAAPVVEPASQRRIQPKRIAEAERGEIPKARTSKRE